MGPEILDLKIVNVDTHNNGAVPAQYYGQAKANMVVGPPIPADIVNIQNLLQSAAAVEAGKSRAIGTIVVLPEFILQPTEGYYTNGQRQVAENYLTNILATYNGNHLIVFGSMVYENGGQFFNNLCYGIGGGALQVCSKRLVSHIDAIPNPAVGGAPKRLAGVGGVLYRSPNPWARVLWSIDPRSQDTIMFKRRRVGFSICLDYVGEPMGDPASRNIAPVNIHIVSSCGMAFEQDDPDIKEINNCVNMGKVIVCDALQEMSIVAQVNQYGQKKQRTIFRKNNQGTHVVQVCQMTMPN